MDAYDNWKTSTPREYEGEYEFVFSGTTVVHARNREEAIEKLSEDPKYYISEEVSSGNFEIRY